MSRDERKKPLNLRKTDIGPAIIAHVNEIEEEDMKHVIACLSIIAIANPDNAGEDGEDGLHIYNFGGGEPTVLAGAIVKIIDQLSDQVDGFKSAFENELRVRQLKSVIDGFIAKVDEAITEGKEAAGMDAAAPAAKELLDRLKAASKGK